MKKMKIVADSKIPYLRGVLEPFAEMVYLSPEEIDADAVRDADALIIRTRTACNAELLTGSNVKMIATATIGFDHIDREYCKAKGIVWKNAPGCNATSVAQYILSSLSLLAIEKREALAGKTIGIVGVGNVGKSVEKECRILGMKILRCDPPRAQAEGEAGFVSLETIAREADFITFHTPLTREGSYPTFHMADDSFFSRLRKKPVVFNTSRGEVIEENSLKNAAEKGMISEMIIDCWEHEPSIDRELMAMSYLSTPHIAGYSADGKSNATRMAVENIAGFFGFTPDLSTITPPEPMSAEIDASLYPNQALMHILLNTYDPREDTARLENSPETFEKQRGSYPLRREYRAFTVKNAQTTDIEQLGKLGFTVIG
ncbi:MAG: 4-phosphoerythronate dehydrogenase PdxB [Bacteroidales bacterium]